MSSKLESWSLSCCCVSLITLPPFSISSLAFLCLPWGYQGRTVHSFKLWDHCKFMQWHKNIFWLYSIPFLIIPNVSYILLTSPEHWADVSRNLSTVTPKCISWMAIANLEPVSTYEQFELFLFHLHYFALMSISFHLSFYYPVTQYYEILLQLFAVSFRLDCSEWRCQMQSSQCSIYAPF